MIITNVQEVGKKSRTHTVTPNGRGFYVDSGSSGEQYYVRLQPQPSCTCRWAQYQPPGRPVACSHVQAVVRFVAGQDGYSVTARPQDQDVSHLHRKARVIGNGVQVTLRRA